ncbi:MAG: hypothetical protein K6E51_05390 [Treponema sp.]|nr:hypothetical protein [Treponema sp.]
MGIYLNPSNQNFSAFVTSGRYVDKTMLIDETNWRLDDPTFKFVCVSRPRCFGKSIAENILSSLNIFKVFACKKKLYLESLASWHGNLLFVGINYDEKTKKHECRIERFVKN